LKTLPLAGNRLALLDVFSIEDYKAERGPDFYGFTPAVAVEIKIHEEYIIVITSTGEPLNNCQFIARQNAPLIVYLADEERVLAESGSASHNGVTLEQRAMFITKSQSPSRAGIEEFSERFFNILKYSDDERIIMLLKMFISQGIVRKLQVPSQKLVNLFLALRASYNMPPYNNWTHACDVTQFVLSCIVRGKLKQYFNDLEIFALLLAAMSHDLDHRGLNNAFNKKARTSLGILYEDRPVMEMQLCAMTIRLLSMPEYDVLEGIENYAERCVFYEFFIKLILATDMDKDFQYIKDFEAITTDFEKRDELHRLLLAQISFKSGDVSNTTRRAMFNR
jgi:hypothetical protein